MKKIIFYSLIPFFLLSLSGCHFLRGGEGDPYMEDEMADEDFGDESSDEFLIEDEDFEDSGAEGDFGELEDEDFGEEGEDFAELEEEEDFEEEEFDEEEGEKKGFFSRLFGGGKDEEDEGDYEEVDFGDEEEFGEESVTEEFVEESAEVAMTEASDESQEETQSATVQDTVEEPAAAEPTAVSRKALNKILKFAYNKAGILVNAVYIARPNENLLSVSQKIYGQDRTKDLLAVNTHLQDRAVVVGDKIYYNSPNRPNDNAKILFYYEDNNRSPSYYNLSEGENIREASYKLLGHSNSWKEIWATNPDLESKGAVEQSLRIAYWEEGASAPQAVTAQPEELQPMGAPSDIAQAGAPQDSFQPPNLVLPEPEPAVSGDEPVFPEPLANQAPAPEDIPQPAESNKRGSGNDIISKLLENMPLLGGVFAFFIIIFLGLRIIFKKRKQRDFDYTSV